MSGQALHGDGLVGDEPRRAGPPPGDGRWRRWVQEDDDGSKEWGSWLVTGGQVMGSTMRRSGCPSRCRQEQQRRLTWCGLSSAMDDGDGDGGMKVMVPWGWRSAMSGQALHGDGLVGDEPRRAGPPPGDGRWRRWVQEVDDGSKEWGSWLVTGGQVMGSTMVDDKWAALMVMK
ncbi:hypothetical protein Dimus_000803 [Dionaea muscipula]